MATINELDTFVHKFKQLWKSGHDAHLDIESKAGKAWVSLHLCLNDEPGPLHQQFKLPKTTNPSRDRRRQRREAARNQTIETKSEENNATEEEADVSNNIIKEIGGSENAAVPEAEENDSGLNESNVADKIEEEKATASEADEQACDIVENIESMEIVEAEETNKNDTEKVGESDQDNSGEAKPVEIESIPSRPAVETVYATVVLEKTSESQVTNAEINAIQAIIRSKEHLNRNIISVNIGSVHSYQPRCGEFEHCIQIAIYVSTANLWESSRSYIFHHLGKHTWSMHNGSEISLKRIHQKT